MSSLLAIRLLTAFFCPCLLSSAGVERPDRLCLLSSCEEPVDGLLELVLTGVGGGTFPLSPPPVARPEVGVVADGLVLRVTAVPFSPTLCSDEVEELGLFVPVDPREDLGLGLGEIPGLFPPFTELPSLCCNTGMPLLVGVLIRDVEPGAPVLAPTDLPDDGGGGFDAGFDCRESEPCRRNGTFDGFCSSLFVLLVVVVVVAGV